MSDKAKNLVRAWQQLRKNRGIIALPEPGWEDWQAVDEAIAVECTVPAPQPTARTAEEKAAKLEELRQSYDCGNMGWSEAVGLYCAWREPKEVPNDEVKSGKYPIAQPSEVLPDKCPTWKGLCPETKWNHECGIAAAHSICRCARCGANYPNPEVERQEENAQQ
jgi:hypothetical protein